VHDPQGDELALNVRLIEEYGVEAVVSALGRMPASEDEADVVVSTAHKAKGREWDTVKLADDFSRTDDEGEPQVMSKAEWRLLYVACTRAKRVLDVSQCAPVMGLLGQTSPKTERRARGLPVVDPGGYARDLILPTKGSEA
jgi:superfamily I DNA/RNA helicase